MGPFSRLGRVQVTDDGASPEATGRLVLDARRRACAQAGRRPGASRTAWWGQLYLRRKDDTGAIAHVSVMRFILAVEHRY